MPGSTHPYFESAAPFGIAHRGGAREAPENSLTAFRNAARVGFDYFETDVRATSDGKVMVFHDASLNRVTDRVGRISALPYSEVRKAKIAGVDQILRVEELLEEFPDKYFNIDIKDEHTVAPFVKVAKKSKALDRICIASFSGSRLRAVRRGLGTDVASSLAPGEVGSLIAASRLGPASRLANLGLPQVAGCVQVPPKQAKFPIVTSAFVKAAHSRGLQVHVWTIDSERDMRSLLELGVDAIMTDRPTLLSGILDDHHSSGERA